MVVIRWGRTSGIGDSLPWWLSAKDYSQVERVAVALSSGSDTNTPVYFRRGVDGILRAEFAKVWTISLSLFMLSLAQKL